MIEGFEERLADFMTEWEQRVLVNYENQFGTTSTFKGLETNKRGRRYTKLISGGSVVAFVDKNTGDIYKPASWKAPAKHVRGNIFSKDGGFEAVARPDDYIFSIRYLK